MTHTHSSCVDLTRFFLLPPMRVLGMRDGEGGRVAHHGRMAVSRLPRLCCLTGVRSVCHQRLARRPTHRHTIPDTRRQEWQDEGRHSSGGGGGGHGYKCSCMKYISSQRPFARLDPAVRADSHNTPHARAHHTAGRTACWLPDCRSPLGSDLPPPRLHSLAFWPRDDLWTRNW